MNAINEHEKISHRYMRQYFHLKDSSPANIKAGLDSILGESATSFSIKDVFLGRFLTMQKHETITLHLKLRKS